MKFQAPITIQFSDVARYFLLRVLRARGTHAPKTCNTLRSGKHRRPIQRIAVAPAIAPRTASPRFLARLRQTGLQGGERAETAHSLSPRAPEYARSSGLKGPGEFWSPAMATTVASFWPLLVPGLAEVHVVHGRSRDGRAPSTWRKKHQTPSRRFLEIHPAPRVRQHPPRARADATSVISF